MEHTWVPIEGDRTHCTVCDTVFTISDGEVCKCSATTDAAPEEIEQRHEDARRMERLGSVDYWRMRIRTADTEFKKLGVVAQRLNVDDRWTGANQIAKQRLRLEVLDRQRKNAWAGFQAALGDKADEELAEKKRLIARAEAIERRSRGH